MPLILKIEKQLRPNLSQGVSTTLQCLPKYFHQIYDGGFRFLVYEVRSACSESVNTLKKLHVLYTQPRLKSFVHQVIKEVVLEMNTQNSHDILNTSLQAKEQAECQLAKQEKLEDEDVDKDDQVKAGDEDKSEDRGGQAEENTDESSSAAITQISMDKSKFHCFLLVKCC